MKHALRVLKTVLNSSLKLTLVSLVSPFARAYYGDWWTIREVGLTHLGSVKGKLLTLIFERELARCGAWIGRQAKFASPPTFPHGMNGIFISNQAKVGARCVLFQHAMIVSNQLADSARRGAPTLGDDVFVSCGAVIVGAVSVGDGCRLGTNVVVHQDLAPHSVAVTQGARVIERDSPMDNRHLSM